MAINPNLVAVLRRIFPTRDNGALLTLGRQTVRFGPEVLSRLGCPLQDAAAQQTKRKGRISQEELFQALGWRRVDSLDVSDYEGATHIFDLNSADAPQELTGAYDLVFNGGTVEHVFHAGRALCHGASFIKPGGHFFSVAPCNDWVDHGFYQISPTLMFDYFQTNGFEIRFAALGLFDRGRSSRTTSWTVVPARPGASAKVANGTARRSLFLFCARRLENSTTDRVPTQSRYLEDHGHEGIVTTVPIFLPFSVHNGTATSLPFEQTTIAPKDIQHVEGKAYRAALAALKHLSGSERQPFDSPAVLLEDGKELCRVTHRERAVAEHGGGLFRYWRGELLFSTSDNSDPRDNGRSYALARPKMPRKNRMQSITEKFGLKL